MVDTAGEGILVKHPLSFTPLSGFVCLTSIRDTTSERCHEPPMGATRWGATPAVTVLGSVQGFAQHATLCHTSWVVIQHDGVGPSIVAELLQGHSGAHVVI